MDSGDAVRLCSGYATLVETRGPKRGGAGVGEVDRRLSCIGGQPSVHACSSQPPVATATELAMHWPATPARHTGTGSETRRRTWRQTDWCFAALVIVATDVDGVATCLRFLLLMLRSPSPSSSSSSRRRHHRWPTAARPHRYTYAKFCSFLLKITHRQISNQTKKCIHRRFLFTLRDKLTDSSDLGLYRERLTIYLHFQE